MVISRRHIRMELRGMWHTGDKSASKTMKTKWPLPNFVMNAARNSLSNGRGFAVFVAIEDYSFFFFFYNFELSKKYFIFSFNSAYLYINNQIKAQLLDKHTWSNKLNRFEAIHAIKWVFFHLFLFAKIRNYIKSYLLTIYIY